jgi:hypothetical protein
LSTDAIELGAGQIELPDASQRDGQPEMRRHVLRILRDGGPVIGDGRVVVTLQLAHLAERAIEGRRGGQLLAGVFQRGRSVRQVSSRREQLGQRHVREHRVESRGVDERHRRAEIGIGCVVVAEVLLDLPEQEEERDALRELLLRVEQLLLGVRQALEGNLGLRVVRDRLRRARVVLQRRVEAREGLREPPLAQQQTALAVQRLDVARVQLHGLREGLTRLAGCAPLEVDPRHGGVRAR